MLWLAWASLDRGASIAQRARGAGRAVDGLFIAGGDIRRGASKGAAAIGAAIDFRPRGWFYPVESTPQEFADRIKVELEKWRSVIQAANIKPG
jgi:hypothetical protein